MVSAGETALTLAAGSAEEQTVSLLLKHGADVSRCRPGGAQPIHTAAASGDNQTIHTSLHKPRPTRPLLCNCHAASAYIDSIAYLLLLHIHEMSTMQCLS